MLLILLVIVQTIFSVPNDDNIAKYSKNNILVKFKNKSSVTVQQSFLKNKNFNKIKSINKSGIKLVELNKQYTVKQALDLFKKNPDVEYAEPNYIYKAFAVPDDTRYNEQWGLTNSYGMPALWDKVTDCSSIKVAVLDTGINYNHEDLINNMWSGIGKDFVSNDNDPMDLHGHGTHVAGIIGAQGNNGKGVAGVCWNATIMAVRVLDATGSGYLSDIISGIDYAVTNGAKIINMSLGGSGASIAYYEAINDARDDGVVFVVAAGNFNVNVDINPVYPCSYNLDNILCVAAVDSSNVKADFSNYGKTSVDVAATGENILSTHNNYDDDIVYDFEATNGDWSINGTWDDDNTVSTDAGDVRAITNPVGYNGTVNYDNGRDDQASKDLGDFTSDQAVILDYFVRYDTYDCNDSLFVLYNQAEPNLFDFNQSYLTRYCGTSGLNYDKYTFDLLDCAGSANCFLGLHFVSNASLTAKGVAIVLLTATGRNINADNLVFESLGGTSMATPFVSGLAAAIWAKEPNYTYTNVINAIKHGGTSVTALQNYVATSKVINGIGSYKYINTPTNVAASVIASDVK